FHEQARRTFDLANRFGDSVSCIYIDLNDFKPINDRHGHEVGDLVLKKFAQYVLSRIRRTDTLARLGGDEFAILLPRLNYIQATRLKDHLRENLTYVSLAEEGYPEISLSASFGVATTRPDICSFEEILNRADSAMYEEKEKSKKEKLAKES
ncbi:MAG: GGDEF domain-containing protein, partial [Deltaproteobacteria bacterium]|nr:GGDEF domain-containing protein [Deltaproteobacteria bacterium]